MLGGWQRLSPADVGIAQIVNRGALHVGDGARDGGAIVLDPVALRRRRRQGEGTGRASERARQAW